LIALAGDVAGIVGGKVTGFKLKVDQVGEALFLAAVVEQGSNFELVLKLGTHVLKLCRRG